MQSVTVLLFDDFTTLDAFGPTEVLGRLKDHFTIEFVSLRGGLVAGSAGTRIETTSIDDVKGCDIFLLPGGFGARQLVDDEQFINHVKTLAEMSRKVLTVCTGSALLARTGLLKHKKATSNKMSWEWAIQQDPEVHWIKQARWTVDGKYYTSSGITAGIDMALGFIADTFSYEIAKRVAHSLEYLWHEDKNSDPFA